MTTLMPNEDYRELFRKRLEHQYLITGIAMLAMNVLVFGVLYFQFFREFSFTTKSLIFALSFFMLPLLMILQFYQAFKSHKEISPHYSYSHFEAYQTAGLKVPTSRIIQSGESTQTLYMILDFVDDYIILLDNKKRQISEYKRYRKIEATFRFRQKLVDGIWTFKTRFDLVYNGKVKETFHGLPQINELLYNYLKKEHYQLEDI